MHLFRSVFIVAVATFAFVATEAPQASAFILPLTRYMLDAVPEGSDAPAAGAVPGADNGGLGAVSNGAVSSVDSDVPVAVETPVVAEDQNKAEEAPVASAISGPEASSNISEAQTSNGSPAVQASSALSAAPSVSPSGIPSDKVLAQTNSAHRVTTFGGPSVLLGSLVAIVAFVL
ncbi:hypothetical protein C8Q79DRAFT_1015088 [Trametes meyenii]|nr:hypothetical protein C8Q79DRAFT_1015088 [Trametes meyenii]